MPRSRLDFRCFFRVEDPFLVATYGEIVSAAFLESMKIRLRNVPQSMITVASARTASNSSI